MGSSGAWARGPAQVSPSGPARISTGVSARRTADGRPHGRRRQLVLGTAAATVAGVVGGAMLLDGIRSMMGGHHSFGGDHAGGMSHAAASPWDGGSDHGSGNLARDAGLGDIGSGGNRAAAYDDSSRSGFLSDDASGEPDDQGEDDFDAGDMGGGRLRLGVIRALPVRSQHAVRPIGRPTRSPLQRAILQRLIASAREQAPAAWPRSGDRRSSTCRCP